MAKTAIRTAEIATLLIDILLTESPKNTYMNTPGKDPIKVASMYLSTLALDIPEMQDTASNGRIGTTLIKNIQ